MSSLVAKRKAVLKKYHGGGAGTKVSSGGRSLKTGKVVGTKGLTKGQLANQKAKLEANRNKIKEISKDLHKTVKKIDTKTKVGTIKNWANKLAEKHKLNAQEMNLYLSRVANQQHSILDLQGLAKQLKPTDDDDEVERQAKRFAQSYDLDEEKTKSYLKDVKKEVNKDANRLVDSSRESRGNDVLDIPNNNSNKESYKEKTVSQIKGSYSAVADDMSRAMGRDKGWQENFAKTETEQQRQLRDKWHDLSQKWDTTTQPVADKLLYPLDIPSRLSPDSPVVPYTQAVKSGAKTILIDYPVWMPVVAGARFGADTIMTRGKNIYDMATQGSEVITHGSAPERLQLGTEIIGGHGLQKGIRARNLYESPEAHTIGQKGSRDGFPTTWESITGRENIRLTPKEWYEMVEGVKGKLAEERALRSKGIKDEYSPSKVKTEYPNLVETAKKTGVLDKNSVLTGSGAILSREAVAKQLKGLADQRKINVDFIKASDLDIKAKQKWGVKKGEIEIKKILKAPEEQRPYLIRQLAQKLKKPKKLMSRREIKRQEKIVKGTRLTIGEIKNLPELHKQILETGAKRRLEVKGTPRDDIMLQLKRKAGVIDEGTYKKLVTPKKEYMEGGVPKKDIDFNYNRLSYSDYFKATKDMMDLLGDDYTAIQREIKSGKGRFRIDGEELGASKDIFTGEVTKKGKVVRIGSKEYILKNGKLYKSGKEVGTFENTRGKANFKVMRLAEKNLLEKYKKALDKSKVDDPYLIDIGKDKFVNRLAGKLKRNRIKIQSSKNPKDKVTLYSERKSLFDQLDRATGNSERWQKGALKVEKAMALGLILENKKFLGITRDMAKRKANRLTGELLERGEKAYSIDEQGRNAIYLDGEKPKKVAEIYGSNKFPSMKKKRPIKAEGIKIQRRLESNVQNVIATKTRGRDIKGYDNKDLARNIAIKLAEQEQLSKSSKGFLRDKYAEAQHQKAVEKAMIEEGRAYNPNIHKSPLRHKIEETIHRVGEFKPEKLKLWTRKKAKYVDEFNVIDKIHLNPKKKSFSKTRLKEILDNEIKARVNKGGDRLYSEAVKEIDKIDKKKFTRQEADRIVNKAYRKVKSKIKKENVKRLKQIEEYRKSGKLYEDYKRYNKYSKYKNIRLSYVKYPKDYGKLYSIYKKPIDKPYFDYNKPNKIIEQRYPKYTKGKGTSYTETKITEEILKIPKIPKKPKGRPDPIKRKGKKEIKNKGKVYVPIVREYDRKGHYVDKRLIGGKTIKDAIGIGMDYTDKNPETSFTIFKGAGKGVRFRGKLPVSKFTKRHGRWYEKAKYRKDSSKESQVLSRILKRPKY